MFVYKKVPFYSQRTGQIDGYTREAISVVDDFTGEMIEKGGGFSDVIYSIKIDYNNGSEEAWYYDELPAFLKTKGKNEDYPSDHYQYLSRFWNEPYHFFFDLDSDQDSSFSLMREWFDGWKKKENLFFNCTTIDEAFRRSRVSVFSKLLKEKKMDIYNFSDSLD